MDTPSPLLDEARRLRARGRHLEAVSLLRQALRRGPGEAELHHELGNALRSLGRHEEALVPLREAVRLSGDNPIFWLNLGVTHYERDMHAEALECFQRALALAPDFPELRNILGCCLLALGRSSEATTQLREALRLRPDYAAAHNNLARCLRSQGRMQEALACYERSLQLQPNAACHSNALMALNYLDGLSPALLAQQHREWGRLHADHFAPPPGQPRVGSSPASRRLRLGYVSGDLCNHAVAFFIAPILAHHDRARFEVTCYSNTLAPDQVTARLRSLCEHWRDIARLDDETVARLIREDGIDLLVDLSGHSAHNRLLVFARRPAPLQLTWLGYPSTTGLSTIDYRISDERCLPSGWTDSQGSERILRLPDCFTCYEPPRELPEPAMPGRHGRGGPPMFCSFSNLAKLSTPTLALWARLLAAQPGSRLLLKSPGAADAGAQERILGVLAAGGVSKEQVQFHGRPLPLREHLALYAECDVALDPFPYNGTTTTCEALLMGVPVVTLRGDSHVSRVGHSLLSCIGHAELVASDEEDYLRIACSLAGDRPRLESLRTGLRPDLLASPLCQAETFTRNYEAALLGLLRQSA